MLYEFTDDGSETDTRSDAQVSVRERDFQSLTLSLRVLMK